MVYDQEKKNKKNNSMYNPSLNIGYFIGNYTAIKIEPPFNSAGCQHLETLEMRIMTTLRIRI